ncbi:MAG: hypothetical protein B6D65_01875 [candidate division Zixibacteria bacterium 4484_93]|nr:MAG: hypothetical protein B6D65_01875 [candidate division Zixibacteria bacterium 4484_93]RKZ34527.1 MAG: hypothetical protein DRQ19_00870 [bacterium]
MYPILFRLGPFELRSYGVMLTIAFITGYIIATKRARKVKLSPDIILNIAVIIVVSAIVGSRLFYIASHTSKLTYKTILTAFLPIQADGTIGISGLSMMGGIALAILAPFIYIKLKKLSFLKIVDVIAPEFLLGVGITRIGCFLNGCCYGKPCQGFLCFVFSPNSAAGSRFFGTPILATQLISSFMGFLLFALVMLLERYKKFDGYSFALTLILYSIDRSIIDTIRYYSPDVIMGHIGNIQIVNNHIILGLLFIVGIFVFLYYGRRKGKVENK